MPQPYKDVLRKIDSNRWEVPKSYKEGMLVPALIYTDENMLGRIWEDQAFQQLVNLSFLPGVVGRSLAMPGIHADYGFPVGGVAATTVQNGVISPAAVGADINCGVRLLRTNLSAEEVRPKIKELMDALFDNIPSGVGSEGKIRISLKELDKVLQNGAAWAVEKGLGNPEDLIVTEESGQLKGADPTAVSERAEKRGLSQLGTLGYGSHFLEVQVVDQVYDRESAKAMGILETGQVLFQIHTGSRGLGRQVCDDFIKIMGESSKKYGIPLPDRQLACAPVDSPEGKAYLKAVACAANYAWANRQCIAHWVRESFVKVMGKTARELGLEQVYDVAHNTAKIESHNIDGKVQSLCVHRKGATRAFAQGNPELPAIYRNIGQPVLIPGDMGRYSFIAVGTETAMLESFGSACHGAGRPQLRRTARKALRGTEIASKLAQRGIIVKADNLNTLIDEASDAYQDVAEVVEVAVAANLIKKVARTVPLGVVKG